MKGIVDFLEENRNTIFRYLTYNRFNIWTPKQQEKKYCDESVYLDDHYEFAKINDIIITPNNELLIEFDIIDEGDHTLIGRKEYKYLKDIELYQFDYDNNGENNE